MLPVHFAMIREEEEEERRNAVVGTNLHRRIMRNASDPFAFSDIEFKNLYRLDKQLVRHIFHELSPHMSHSTHPNAVSPMLRILAALFFFANGSYQRVIGHSHILSMGQTTVSKCITEVSALILEHLADTWISFPNSQEEKLHLKSQFMQKFNFPGVIGAVDCTHVAIVAPRDEEHNFVNRKGYHSKNVQIVSRVSKEKCVTLIFCSDFRFAIVH